MKIGRVFSKTEKKPHNFKLYVSKQIKIIITSRNRFKKLCITES